MDFGYSARSLELQRELTAFINERVIPAEAVYEHQIRAATNPHQQPAIMEELKKIARDRGLWNLFMTHGDWGAGLTNADYAPLAGIVGRSIIGPEAINCSAPDTADGPDEVHLRTIARLEFKRQEQESGQRPGSTL